MAQTVLFIGSNLSHVYHFRLLPRYSFSSPIFLCKNIFHKVTEVINSLYQLNIRRTLSAFQLTGITGLMYSFISLNLLALRTETLQWLFGRVTKRVLDFPILLPAMSRTQALYSVKNHHLHHCWVIS